MLAIRTEDNKTFKQIQTPAFEDRVLADGGEVTTLDNTDKLLDGVVALNPSLVMVPSGYKASKLYSQVPYSGLGDMTVTRSGDTGMRLNNGYWQPVAANVPRIDLTWNEATQMFEQWLQVEELRTNLLPRYKTFPHSDWTKSGARIEGDPSNLGVELIPQPLNLTSGYTNVNITSISANGFTTSANGGVQRDILTPGKIYKVIVSGLGLAEVYETGATLIKVADNINSEFIFTATYSTIYIRTIGAQTISALSFSVKEVKGYASPFVDSAGANLMDGYKLVEGTTNAAHYIYTGTITSSGNNNVFSLFVKSAGRTKVGVKDGDSSHYSATFNITTQSVIWEKNAGSAAIQAVGNGWYRIDVKETTGASLICRIYTLDNNYTTGDPAAYSYLGDGTSGILIAHAQLEAGATASSPIGGAEGSSQTRNADVIVKTGASALIGQTEGYAVVEVNISKFYATSRTVYYITDGTFNNRLRILIENNILVFRLTINGVVFDKKYTLPSLGIYKIGIAYKTNENALYINGSAVDSNFAGIINPSGIIANISLGSSIDSSSFYYNDNIKLVGMGKTRISNEKLIELTTL